MDDELDDLEFEPERRRRDRLARRDRVRPGMWGGQYRPLSTADVLRIHDASLEVLARTGVEMPGGSCMDVFMKAGAKVDPESGRLLIPRRMVEDALAWARNEVLLCGRDPENDISLGGRRVYLGTGGAAVHVIDLETQEARPARLQDVADIARLVDTLENIHFYLRPVTAQDVPEDVLDVNTFYAALANTTKHVTGSCQSPESLREVAAMAEMIAGHPARLRTRPIISVTASWMISPLRFDPGTAAVLKEAVVLGIPVFLSSAPQAGSTSPAALAGTLVQINAEELAGLTYCQLLQKGAPVVLGYVPSVADLRTGNFAGGASEFALMNAAAAQISQFYDLPVYNSAGLTEAKLPDVQAGYEKGINTLSAALAGSNYIHHAAGFLESLMTVAFEQYVIDDDIIGSILRMVRGIEVNDETLSVELIDQVCRGEGHYLATDQSARLARSEFYYPHTSDRKTRSEWELQGRPDVRERARRQARKILASHVPEPIDAEVDAAIRKHWKILI